MKRSITAAMVVMMSMLYAVFCQGQILGTGQLGTARRSHTATLMQDGKILIVVVDDANGLVGQAEIFDPASLTSSNIAASPIALRTDHTATLLSDGRVLIIGGVDSNGLLGSTEFYNPSSVPAPSFSAGPALMRARSGHSATMLSDGKILIVGGESSGSAEIFDPATQSFSLASGSLNTPRQYHSAALLNSGKVLIAGGVVGTNTTLISAEIYDPQTQTFTPASGQMQTPRGFALLRVLPDGKVQVIGGDGEFSMEMFDPATNSFIALAHIPLHQDYLDSILASRTRSALITTIIQQNPVLQGQPELTAEIIALLNRLDHTVTEIPQLNKALIAGGVNDAGQILNSATMVSSSAATITTDKFDYAPGQTVTITGSGFQPNETVWMLFHEEPETHADVTISSVADGQGNFTNLDFAPAENDLNRNFTLTAIGQSSGFTAQTAFRDARQWTLTLAGAGAGSVTIDTTSGANPGTVNAPVSCGGTGTNVTSQTVMSTCAPNISLSNNSATGTLTATPNGTSFFAGWSAAANFIGCTTTSPCSFSVTAASPALTVTFSPRTATTTTAANATSTFKTTSQTVTLSATVTSTSTVNEGTVTFTVKDGATMIGSATTSGTVTAGSASVSYSLPAATAAKVYTIQAVYNPAASNPRFNTSSDNTKTLTVNAASTTTTAANQTTTFSTSAQNVTLSATVTSAAGTVNEGTVTFTVKDGATTIGSATTSSTVSGGNASVSYSLPAATTAKTYSIQATYNPSTNYTTSSDNNKTLTVNPASTTTSAANQTTTFSQGAQNVTLSATVTSAAGTVNEGTVTFTVKDGATTIGSATTSSTVSGGNASVSYALPAATTAKTYTIQATYNPAASNPNFTTSSDATKTLTIQKADTTTLAANKTATFSSTDQTVTLTATVTSAAGTVNEGTVTFTVKQGATIIGSPVTSATITTGSASANFTLPGDTAAVTYTIEAAYSGGTDFNTSNDNTKTLTVQKADTTTATVNASATFSNADQTVSLSATVTSTAGTVNQGTVTFTIKTLDGLTTIGTPITSATVSGGNASASFTLPANTAAGDYKIEAVYSGGSNFNGSSDTTKKLTVTKAAIVTTVTVADATYDALPHGGTASVTGPGLNQALTVTYTGISGTTYGPSTTAPTNAGTYSASASYAESANYFGSSDSKNFTINKADSATTLSGTGSFTYDALAHAATANVTGVGGLNQAVPVVYSGNCSAAPINVAETPCTVTATFAGDANHNGSSATGTITITKATSTTTVTVVDATYDSNPHGGSAVVTGVGGLNQALTVYYAGTGSTVYPSSTIAPTNAGDYSASASFAGDANHNGSSDSKNFTINKAASITTVTVAGGVSFPYDGNSHPATVSVTGVGGLSLTPAPLYSCGHAPIDVADTGCTASYTYAGDANHNGSSDSKTYTITKAASTTTVTVSDATYDGNPHGGIASVTGVGGLNQALTVYYAGTGSTAYPSSTIAPTNAGTYSTSASFAGDANHDGSSDSKNFTINKANPIVTATGNTCTYDGNPCAGSGSAIGVQGESLTPVTVAYKDALNNLLTSAPVAAGVYLVAARYAGDANYNQKQSAPAAITINKAASTTVVTVADATYDSNPHGSSAVVTGAGGLNQALTVYYAGTGSTVYPSSAIAPINAGSYSASASYAGDANHDGSSDSKNFTINQAFQTITVTLEPPLNAYFGQTFTVAATANSGLAVSIGSSGSCSGSGSGSALITMNAGSGNCAITFDQIGDSNYQAAAQVSRNVTALNTAPVAQAQSLTTPEDAPLVVTLSGSDIDNSGLTFSIVNLVNLPAHGSLGIIGAQSCTASGIGANCTATVTYTPAADFNGSDSFSFKVNDGQADSNVAAVSITVSPLNDTPTANSQTVTANSGAPQSISLTGIDIETPDGFLTLKIVTLPGQGTLTDGLNNILAVGSTLTGSPASVIYTPLSSYAGPDSFKFTVTDRGDPDGCASAPCSPALTSPEAMVSISVTDATAPDTIITSMPASLSNNPAPTFEFTGTDNVNTAGELVFECKLDTGVFLACTSPVHYSGLSEGAHTFQVRAKDSTGNLDGIEASYTWTIDLTPPDTVIDSGPSSFSNTATVTFTFHSTENRSTFLCTVDSLPVACGGGTYTTASLSDGQHTFTVAAVDLADNVDPTPATATWTIDTLAPDTTINSNPANPTTSTSATFVFSSANSPGDTYECRLDGIPASFTPCSSPASYTGLAMGTHTFEVRGKDVAGNMETSPAMYNWTIGAVTLENYTMDSNFKRFDGFDVVFGKGSGSSLKINSTNPDSFHYQIKLTNNTGTPIGAAYGNLATAIITVPGLTSCGGVPCSTMISSSLADPAFIVRGKKVVHVSPGHHERDDGDDDDDMPVTIQYKSSGSCEVSGGYSSTLPSNGAPKCIKITGFSIPVKHAARIRLNFQFRLKGTDGWNANAQQLFYAGFVFRAATSVNFGGNIQTATDATGLVGAGKKATAIGGYAFNNLGAPLSGYAVRIFTKPGYASCTDNSKLIAQESVDTNGFYYIWRSGLSQTNTNAPSLPSGVQYAVQLCNGATQVGLKSIDSKLRDKEFEQVDFDL